MVFDTGSAWTWVYTKEGCFNHPCPDVEKFSLEKSQTAASTESKNESVTLDYGQDRMVRGYVVYDKFCLSIEDPNSCVNNFTFLGTYSS